MTRVLPLLLVATAMIAAPYFFYPFFLMKFLCFAILACSFNLMLGYGGLLSFGHAAFFGAGAYIAGYALRTLGWPTEIAIAMGVVCATLLGFGFGLIAIRRHGLFFSMVTLALSQFVYFVFLQAPFTGGENGLQGVPRTHLLGFVIQNDRTLYFLVAAIACAAGVGLWRITRSPFGAALILVRENESRAISLGYSPKKLKLIAFILSSAGAGLAGSLNVIVLRFASLSDIDFAMSGDIVMMAVIGGTRFIFGPALGALLITGMQNYLASTGEWVMAIQGGVFVATIMLAPGGLAGAFNDLFRWLSGSVRRRLSPIVARTGFRKVESSKQNDQPT